MVYGWSSEHVCGSQRGGEVQTVPLSDCPTVRLPDRPDTDMCGYRTDSPRALHLNPDRANDIGGQGGCENL